MVKDFKLLYKQQKIIQLFKKSKKLIKNSGVLEVESQFTCAIKKAKLKKFRYELLKHKRFLRIDQYRHSNKCKQMNKLFKHKKMIIRIN